MELNTVVAKIALAHLDKFKPDSSLYDAIVEMDERLVKYLCNNKYKLEIINHGFIKEPVNIAKMIEVIEANLFRNTRIRLAC